jgi:hypothetical protein
LVALPDALETGAPAEGTAAAVETALFSEEVEAYRAAQQEEDPDRDRKVQFVLAEQARKDAADDRELERNMRKDQHDRQMQTIDNILEARKTYANKIFCLICAWLTAAGGVLLLTGYHWKTGFTLSDKVLLMLIGGTTVNVLGIFTIVANFLFPKNGGNHLEMLTKTPGRSSDANQEAKPPKKKTTRPGSRKKAQQSA